MTVYDEERLRAVRIVESLRSGIPTRESTREMPDLRPTLMETIRGDLESLGPGKVPPGRLISGEYGEGKSHFLRAVEHAALEMNFAVSFVSLSREVSCHNLFHFYRRVAPVVRTPESQVPGLQAQLQGRKASDLDETALLDPNRYAHRLPLVVLQLFLHSGGGEDSHVLYNDLMGDRLPLAEVRRFAQTVELAPLLKNLPRFKHEHANAYFGVLADAVKLCGYRGWVVLIDEVELVLRLGKVSRLKAYQNLNWLLNWSDKKPYPFYALGAAASSLLHLWHDERGRRPNDPTAVPELARERLGPEAERELREFFRRASGNGCLTIAPVEDGLFDLLERVVQLHGHAHAWTPPEAQPWLRQVTTGITRDAKLRTYIRWVLEALDQQLITGETPELSVSELVEPTIGEDESFLEQSASSDE